jgi:hypothetical protein
MKITERLPLACPLPKAGFSLNDTGSVQTYEAAYGARHPRSAYHLSLELIGRRTIALCESIQATRCFIAENGSYRTGSDDALLDATDHFLDALMEHIEICGGVLRSFFASSKDAAFVKAKASFDTAIRPYRSFIGAVDNYLKHNHGQLRSIAFSWSGDSSLGYFIEGQVAPATRGPVPKFHEGGTTAFSYNRDVRFHLCGLFYVGAQLAAALHAADRHLAPRRGSSADGSPASWVRALRTVAALPDMVFPDEVTKPMPLVHALGEAILIDYPATRGRARSVPHPAEIEVCFGPGDGVTTTLVLPYIKSR